MPLYIIYITLYHCIFFSLCLAYCQRPHPRQQEALCVPVAGLLKTGETVQGAVHAGGPHAEAYRGEAAQVHGKG